MRIASAGIVKGSSNARAGQTALNAVSTISDDQLEGQTTIEDYLSMLTPEGKIIPDDFMNPPETTEKGADNG